jgi:excisionase family DNA binding protein
MNTIAKMSGANLSPGTKPALSGRKRDEPDPACWRAALPEGPLLTISEVRGYLRCSREVVNSLIASRRLPAVRLRRTYRIPLESVQKLVREGVVR